MKKPFSWSYSLLADYESCPKKAWHRRNKTPIIETSPHLARGIAVHDKLEKYLKGKLRSVPKEAGQFKKQIVHLKKIRASAESQYAFDRQWRPTGYFDANVWLRVKLDVCYMKFENGKAYGTTIDFKTGKPSDYPEQERIYAAAFASRFPDLEWYEVQFWFLDHGTVHPSIPAIYKEKRLESIRREYTLRANRLERETKWKERPSVSACKFCNYSFKRGGPCKKAK